MAGIQDVWLILATLAASVLTLPTGFGLGTMLTPVFAMIRSIVWDCCF